MAANVMLNTKSNDRREVAGCEMMRRVVRREIAPQRGRHLEPSHPAATLRDRGGAWGEGLA